MNMKADDIIDIVPEGESASAEDILRFVADIAAGTVSGVICGTINTAADALDGAAKLCSGDVKGAAGIISRRAAGIVTGAIGVATSGAAVTAACYDTLVHNKPFITETNMAHLTHLCQAGVYAAAAGALSDDAPAGTGCALTDDACSRPGVENGVFTGDAQELKALAESGEDPSSTHVAQEDVVRSETAKAAFLQAHGIDDPAGWQVHHIQPLSEGGADDVHNMVLVSPEDHQEITSEHAAFYGWKTKV